MRISYGDTHGRYLHTHRRYTTPFLLSRNSPHTCPERTPCGNPRRCHSHSPVSALRIKITPHPPVAYNNPSVGICRFHRIIALCGTCGHNGYGTFRRTHTPTPLFRYQRAAACSMRYHNILPAPALSTGIPDVIHFRGVNTCNIAAYQPH